MSDTSSGFDAPAEIAKVQTALTAARSEIATVKTAHAATVSDLAEVKSVADQLTSRVKAVEEVVSAHAGKASSLTSEEAELMGKLKTILGTYYNSDRSTVAPPAKLS